MKQTRKILYLTMAISIGFTMTSFAYRFDPNTHVGPVTEEDIQDIEADRAEQSILDNLSGIEYDENTRSYYEDFYPKAGKGSWMQNESGRWYQLEDGSFYKGGWVRVDGKRYYFDENGYMKIGWIEKKTHWYYTDEEGVMVTGSRQIDGTSYEFDAYGMMSE